MNSTDLQQRLTASLKGLLPEVNFAPEYSYKWKWWKLTPGGPPIPALRAGKRKRPLTVDLAGWPTPAANEYESQDRERTAARRAECKEKNANGNGFGLTLALAAQEYLAGWATPTLNDAKICAVPAQMRRKQCDLNVQAVTTLPPPAWTRCPCCENYWCNLHQTHAHDCPCPPVEEWPTDPYTASGTASTSSTAATARSGVLNPAMSRWLQAFPEIWDRCSPGWQAWVTRQRLLARYYARLAATDRRG